MVPVSTKRWEWLEARSPALFLLGGGMVVVYAGLHGIEAATDMVMAPNPFEFGYAVGFLGLLGLVPAVIDDSPWFARVGAVAAVLGAVGLSAFTALHLAVLAGVVERGGPTWFGVLAPLPLIGFVGGYLSIGIASLRADVHTRTVGLVLLAPGFIVVVMLVQILAGWTSQLQAFVISAGQAMAHLAIGATLKTTSGSDHGDSSTHGNVPGHGDSSSHDDSASHGDREVATHD